MKNHFFLFALSTSLLAAPALAGTLGSATSQPDMNFVSTLSAGFAWDNIGKAQTFYLAPNIIKTYTVNNPTHAWFDSELFHGELFIGLQKTVSQTLKGQLGLAVAAISNESIAGTIWDDADPQFANYTYHYKIQNRRAAAKAKILLDTGYWVIPWLNGSLGISFNRAKDFVNTPLIFEALPNPNFSDNTEVNFSYTLGAGVQSALNQHWQIGVGYEFTDWGAGQFGRAGEQTLNSALTSNRFYTHSLLFNLTYLA